MTVSGGTTYPKLLQVTLETSFTLLISTADDEKCDPAESSGGFIRDRATQCHCARACETSTRVLKNAPRENAIRARTRWSDRDIDIILVQELVNMT